MSSENKSFFERYSFHFAAAAAIATVIMALLMLWQHLESKHAPSKKPVSEKMLSSSEDIEEKQRLLEREQALKEEQIAAQRQQKQLQEQIQALQNKLTTLEQQSHATTATASTEASKLKSVPNPVRELIDVPASNIERKKNVPVGGADWLQVPNPVRKQSPAYRRVGNVLYTPGGGQMIIPSGHRTSYDD